MHFYYHITSFFFKTRKFRSVLSQSVICFFTYRAHHGQAHAYIWALIHPYMCPVGLSDLLTRAYCSIYVYVNLPFTCIWQQDSRSLSESEAFTIEGEFPTHSGYFHAVFSLYEMPRGWQEKFQKMFRATFTFSQFSPSGNVQENVWKKPEFTLSFSSCLCSALIISAAMAWWPVYLRRTPKSLCLIWSSKYVCVWRGTPISSCRCCKILVYNVAYLGENVPVVVMYS